MAALVIGRLRVFFFRQLSRLWIQLCACALRDYHTWVSHTDLAGVDIYTLVPRKAVGVIIAFCLAVRPSLQIRKDKKCKQKGGAITSFFQSSSNLTEPTTDSTSSVNSSTQIPMSAQTGRAVIVCVECEKPRVVYSKKKLDNCQRLLLAKTISSYEYSCGAFLFPPSEKRKTAQTLCIRPNLQCTKPIEVTYYGSEIGIADKCSHCASNGGIVDQELKKSYQTVIPICKQCLQERKEAHTQRPFGKQKKNSK